MKRTVGGNATRNVCELLISTPSTTIVIDVTLKSSGGELQKSEESFKTTAVVTLSSKRHEYGPGIVSFAVERTRGVPPRDDTTSVLMMKLAKTGMN
jgi:hypothetical protein